MQVVHVFDYAVFRRSAADDVIPEGKVLHVLAQPDAAGVRLNFRYKPTEKWRALAQIKLPPTTRLAAASTPPTDMIPAPLLEK